MPRTFTKTRASRAYAPYTKKVFRAAQRVARYQAAAGARRRRAYAPRSLARTGGFSGTELRYFDSDLQDQALTPSWAGGELDPAALCLFYPVQGSGPQNRDGARVLVKSVYITGYVKRVAQAAEAAAPEGAIATLALVLDKQTNGATLNAEDVYDTTEPEECTRRVLENVSRFTVLKQWQIPIPVGVNFNDAAGTGAVGGALVPFSANLKLNLPVQFIAGAGAGGVADIRDNSFHMIGVCTHNAPAGGYMTAFKCRFRFIG